MEEVDDHDEREVDEGDEALPICPSDEDFVLGEIGESSKAGLANFTPIARMGHLVSEAKFIIPTPRPPC